LDLPTKITLRVGDHISLPVTGAGTVGYFWRIEVSGDQEAVAATICPRDPPPTVEEPREPRGYSAPQALLLQAQKPGKATIKLKLMRAWTEPRPPREEHQLEVTVQP
jgi:predicted secreted protein